MTNSVTNSDLVKRLEWHGEPNWCFADTPVGHYTVSQQVNPDGFRMTSYGRDRVQSELLATADEAKAAAQADYVARILSALAPPSLGEVGASSSSDIRA